MWINTSLSKIKPNQIFRYQMKKSKKLKEMKYYLCKEEGVFVELIPDPDNNTTSTETLCCVDGTNFVRLELPDPIVLNNSSNVQLYKSDDEIQQEQEQRKLFSDVVKGQIEQELPALKMALIDSASEWIAEAVLWGEKLDVDYSNDPPWDSSGELVWTGERYDLENYDNVGEFLEEYNGLTIATFESGHGFSHQRYEDDLDRMVRDAIWQKLTFIVTKLYHENKDFQQYAMEALEDDFVNEDDSLDMLVMHMAESELADFIDFDLEIDLIDTIREMPFTEICEIGRQRIAKDVDQEKLNIYDRYYELLDTIKSMQGLKILTVITKSDTTYMFELDESGILTSPVRVNGQSHFAHLRSIILDGMQNSGSVVIRQFTSLRIEVETRNGKQFVPIKNLYGIELVNNNWCALSAEELELMYSTDAETGLPLEREPAVRYCTLR